MNKVIEMGRLTRDPEIRVNSTTGNSIARYTLAVDREYKDENGNREADFISCVAFGKQAEFAEKYLSKGTMILVEGRIQTGSYTNKDNQKVYTTDVIVNRHEFCGSNNNNPRPSEQGEFSNIPEGFEEELPFN